MSPGQIMVILLSYSEAPLPRKGTVRTFLKGIGQLGNRVKVERT